MSGLCFRDIRWDPRAPIGTFGQSGTSYTVGESENLFGAEAGGKALLAPSKEAPSLSGWTKRESCGQGLPFNPGGSRGFHRPMPPPPLPLQPSPGGGGATDLKR